MADLTQEENKFEWEHFEDGSGSIVYNGKNYFHYDITTIPNGVEYKLTDNHLWDMFMGSFSEFEKWAEEYMMKYVVQ